MCAPIFHDYCQHGSDAYAGEFDGGDLYFYMSLDSPGVYSWHWCHRYGPEGGEYGSGWVKHIVDLIANEATLPGSTNLAGVRENEYEPKFKTHYGEIVRRFIVFLEERHNKGETND